MYVPITVPGASEERRRVAGPPLESVIGRPRTLGNVASVALDVLMAESGLARAARLDHHAGDGRLGGAVIAASDVRHGEASGADARDPMGGGRNLDVRRLGAQIVVQLPAQVSGVAHPGSTARAPAIGILYSFSRYITPSGVAGTRV